MNLNFENAKEIIIQYYSNIPEKYLQFKDFWEKLSDKNTIYATIIKDNLNNLDKELNDLGYFRKNKEFIEEIKILQDDLGFDIILPKNCTENFHDIKISVNIIVVAYFCINCDEKEIEILEDMSLK